jgi:hypothetical protein
MDALRNPGSGWTAAVALKGLVLALLLACAPLARAAEPGIPAVTSAYVTVQDGVFLLNVRTEYPLTEDLRRALDDGVTLNFDLEAIVQKRRRYWYDADLVDATLRRELSWHAVSERYVLKDLSLGGQQLFVSLEDALAAAGTVQDWPVVVEPQLDPDGIYEISVRAGMRRGRMPDALRLLAFWSDAWSRSSDWYVWVLPR